MVAAAQMRLVLASWRPPARHIVQGVHVGTGVALPAALFFCLPSSVTADKALSDGLLWAAITVVVITLPVLGQAAAMWTQRTVGTLLGGLLACGLLAACRSPAYLSVMAPLLAGAGHCWGEHSSFSYAGKLFAITTLMVLLVPASADVLTVPLARVLGVLGGVLLSALVSTFLLPTTSSCQALQHMHAALCQLAQLAGGVWHSYAASLEAAGALGPGAMQAPAATAAAAPLGGRAAAPSEQAAVEGMLDGVLAAFKQAADSQAAARKEVFMGRAAAGRLLLWLPAWPWADSQRQLAPPALVAAVIAAGRACVRLLWMLHASQAEGFAPEQLRSLQGVHGQQLLEQLPRLADTAFQHTAVQLDAALQRMSGRGGDARQQQQQQQQQQWEDGDAAANSKPSWHGTAARGTAPQESSEPAPPERAAAAAVQALADAVDALIRGSRHNRAALYRELAALQAAAAGGSGSNPAGDAGGASGSTRATTEAATAAAAAAAAAHVAGYVTHNAAPLGTPRSSWHDAGSGAGIDGLLRWHSLEFILERLAQHAAELQAAVAALAAALPS